VVEWWQRVRNGVVVEVVHRIQEVRMKNVEVRLPEPAGLRDLVMRFYNHVNIDEVMVGSNGSTLLEVYVKPRESCPPRASTFPLCTFEHVHSISHTTNNASTTDMQWPGRPIGLSISTYYQ
jgi:hypothetical protein